MGLYQLALFVNRREDHPSLILGLLCLVMAFRTLFTGEHAISVLLPGISWAWRLKLEYLTFYGGRSRVIAIWIFGTTCGLFSLHALLTPVRVFAGYLTFAQVLPVLVFLYCLTIVTIAMVRGKKGAPMAFMGGFVDKYIGDSIMALFPESPRNAVQTAILMQKEIQVYNEHRRSNGYRPIAAGAGIHTGLLRLGTIGAAERMEGTVISDTVNLASRIESLTKAYGASIIVSADTLERMDADAFQTRFLDHVRVKGKQIHSTVYQILDGLPESEIEMYANTEQEYNTYTIGYSGWNRETLLARTRSLKSLLIDVRFSPYSRARPEFNREELARAFGDYHHMEEYGNRNFRGGPVELANPARGARILSALAATENKDLVFLCACGRHEYCHRSQAAAHLKQNLRAAGRPCKVEHVYPDGQGLLFE